MFCVVLVSADTVAVATHRLDEQEMESLLLGLQAGCASSEPNYRPWRLWSDDEMAKAQGRVEISEAGVVASSRKARLVLCRTRPGAPVQFTQGELRGPAS